MGEPVIGRTVTAPLITLLVLIVTWQVSRKQAE
jgi:hypothetical protein